MPSTNWRVANGQIIGGEAAAAGGMGGGDWMNQLPSGSRHRIVYKIMDTLRRHHPFSGIEGLLDLNRTALLLEENIFTAARSPTDYIRKISLKMLDFEIKSQNHSYIHSYAADNPVFSSGEFHGVLNSNIINTVATEGMEGSDWRIALHPESRQRIVNKIVETLKTHLPFSGEEGLQELKNIADRFEEYVYSVATSQCDYLRKISLKMLAVEGKSPNPMASSLLSNSASSSRYPYPNPISPGYAPVYLGPSHMPNHQ